MSSDSNGKRTVLCQKTCFLVSSVACYVILVESFMLSELKILYLETEKHSCFLDSRLKDARIWARIVGQGKPSYDFRYLEHTWSFFIIPR